MSVVIVEGKDVSVYVYRLISGVLTPVKIACETTCSMEFSVELISVMTKDSSGRAEDYEPGAIDCSISVDGVSTLDELPSFQIDDAIDNLTVKQRILFIMTNSYGDRMAYDMYALTESHSVSGDATDFSNFSWRLKRCGDFILKTKVFNALQDNSGNYLLDSDGHLLR